MALRYLLPGQMRFMNDNGMDVVMISAGGKELQEVLESEQCRHIIVPMTRKITPFQDLKCLYLLYKIFRKEKPAIVHTHTPKAGLLGMLAAKCCGVKIRIHTVAGMPLMVEKGFKLKLLSLIEKLTYRAATSVWPNSNSLMQYILKNNSTSPKKLKVIAKGSSNGIDTVRYNRKGLDEKVKTAIKESIHYREENDYLLCIGRLVADKGIVELVNVFSLLQKKYTSLRLILAGEFEEMLDPLPAATLKQIETNSHIFHIGWTGQVEYYMSISDIFVFPSHREGFPNVLLQAGALRLPIICTRIEGNTDLIIQGQTGLLFDKGNENELVQQLEWALVNPDGINEMAKKLEGIVKEDYKQENIWQNILKEYKSLLNLINITNRK